jgi:hypothetical protein
MWRFFFGTAPIRRSPNVGIANQHHINFLEEFHYSWITAGVTKDRAI